MPKYSLNSQAIIVAFFAWLFVNPCKEKWMLFKKNRWLFLLSSSLFWISLMGLLYTENIDEGLRNLQKKTPFLLFPLLFSTVIITNKTRDYFIKYFSFGVVLSAIFALTKAFYFKINNLGDYFYYSEFALLLDKHTTYFALFTVIAILFFIREILISNWKNNLLEIVCVLFLLGLIYILSVRISIIALLLGGIILVWKTIQTPKTKFIILFFLSACITGFFLSPNFVKRFNAFSPENQEISDFSTRKIHWKSALQTMQQNNLIIGAGTGDGHKGLYEMYLKNDFQTGYKYKYNAHNQFIETGLYSGILGLSLLLLILWVAFKITQNHKDLFAFVLLTSITVFMFTESILERHSGIIIFAFFVSLFMIQNPKLNKDKIDMSIN